MGKLVAATEFKAKCLALIDEMERSGEPLTITRRGRPSITLTAERAAPPSLATAFGALKGTAILHDDLIAPIDPEWEAKWLAKWDERLGRRPE